MNKLNSPSSNNSGDSSETSESQSVEETANLAAGKTNNRTTKNWSKRYKDSNVEKEVERPPWRAVSISTLPKPDKNALLRAKLLDASRRLRAGKISVAVQADVTPTKLMREINLGAQIDLILYKEVGILTDGFYTRRHGSSDPKADEFILTYSVSQMTDALTYTNVSTQTLLPKVCGDDFLDAYYSDEPVIEFYNFSDREKKLLQQIRKIRETNIKYPQKFSNEIINSATCSDEGSPSETDTATCISVRNSNNSAKADTSNAGQLLRKPTRAYWNFDYDDLSRNQNTGFQSYTIESNKPWNSFAPAELYLRKGFIGTQQRSWSLLLLAVDELVEESNRLVDILATDEAIKKIQKSENNEVLQPISTAVFKPEIPALPSEYWVPVIQQQEKELHKLLNELNK